MSRKIRILIIEDDDITLSTLTTQLQGHEIRITNDGNQVSDLVQQQRPDIVLLNATLHGHDMLQITRTLRQQDKHTAILIMTTPDHLDAIQPYLQAGVDDILVKPLHNTLLKHALHQAINKLNARKHLHLVQQQLAASELKLKTVTDQRDHFCRDLVHDLNNSLTGIIMTAEMILINDPPATIVKSIEEIIQSSDEINDIIKRRRATIITDD